LHTSKRGREGGIKKGEHKGPVSSRLGARAVPQRGVGGEVRRTLKGGVGDSRGEAIMVWSTGRSTGSGTLRGDGKGGVGEKGGRLLASGAQYIASAPKPVGKRRSHLGNRRTAKQAGGNLK